MNDLFLALALLSIIGLIVGLIAPNLFKKIFKKRTNRKTVSLAFGVGIVVFFILFGITTDGSSSQKVSNQSKTTTPIQSESSKKYEKLTLNAQRDGENIKVDGETDLPNNSKLTIEIDRPNILAGETETRYVKVGWANPIVKDGKYSATVKIEANNGFLDSAASVESKCRITVSFHPTWGDEKIQNDEVLKLVGSKGENLSGQLVKTLGELTNTPSKILETSTSIDFPYNKSTNNPSSSSTDKVSYSNISISKSSGTIRVLGEITNNTNSNISILWITVSFYDSSGKLLDTAVDTEANLGPHDTKTFEAMGLDPGNYKDYKVQIDL